MKTLCHLLGSGMPVPGGYPSNPGYPASTAGGYPSYPAYPQSSSYPAATNSQPGGYPAYPSYSATATTETTQGNSGQSPLLVLLINLELFVARNRITNP